MNKLYFGDNLDILSEHIADGNARFGSEYPKLQILTIEALMAGTERPRFPDLSLGRSTFKRAAVEDVSGEQGKIF